MSQNIEVKTDNPAGRLYTLLKQAKALNNNSGYATWGHIFNIPLTKSKNSIDDDAMVEIIHRVMQLKELVVEVEDKLGKIEGINLSLYLTPFGRIKNALKATNLNLGNYVETLRPITDGDLTILIFCSEELAKHYSEQRVNEDTLKGIIEEVTKLFNEVTKSDLPPELKVFILDQLEVIRRGISEYQIRGIERLRETLGELVGAILVKRETLEVTKDQPEVRKFGTIVQHLMSAVTFASDATTLIAAVSRFLPG